MHAYQNNTVFIFKAISTSIDQEWTYLSIKDLGGVCLCVCTYIRAYTEAHIYVILFCLITMESKIPILRRTMTIETRATLHCGLKTK